MLSEERDGRHGRDADDEAAARPADAAPGPASHGARPPRTHRPREGQVPATLTMHFCIYIVLGCSSAAISLDYYYQVLHLEDLRWLDH